jgi:HEPN domain-containing protein
MRQARRDLEHAQRSAAEGAYEWACFASQQSAEKAVKAAYQKIGAVAWGHSVTALMEQLPEPWRPEAWLLDAARELDKHYIPPRYPDSHPEGAPYDYYTRGEAERAVANADRIIRFCAGVLAGPDGGDRPLAGSGAGPG